MSIAPDKVLSFAQAADEALVSAQNFTKKVAAEKSAAVKTAAALVDVMVDRRLLTDTEKAAALDKLADHNGALEIVGNLLTIIQNEKTANQQRLAAAGQGEVVPDHEKAASNGNGSTHKVTSGFNDGRRGLGEKSAADLAFEKRLGLSF